MQFSLKSLALTTLLLLPGTYGCPTEVVLNAPVGERGCSSHNSGTHCRKSYVVDVRDARNALNDLLSQCINGDLPGGAKRVTSAPYNGVIAYACNGFCRTKYMPCQDAEWSINRVLNGCYNSGRGQPEEGWDSQETRGTWYGVSYKGDPPCGYPWTHRGADY